MSTKKYTCDECGVKLTRLMNYCPSCGEEQNWEDEHGNDECYYCGTEVHSKFNFCFACGEDIEPEGWNDPIERTKGFNLKWECDEECEGNVQEFMSYCPWCGEEQTWDEFYSEDYTCDNCDASVSTEWQYCVFCGDEIDWEGEDYESHPIYNKAIEAAKNLVESPSKVMSLIRQASHKADENDGAISKFFDDLNNLIRLVKAWVSGEYTEVPWRTIILAIAAILYFVWPADAIPDFIPVIGYIDDAAVIALAVKSIGQDLDDFLEWEES